MGKQTTWVATFDGGEARVFRKEAGGALRELESESLSAPHRAGDAPGEVRADGEPKTYSEPMTEAGFVEKVADRLAGRARSGAFDRLIVAAGPKALGEFRKVAPDPLREKIVAEVDKDHVHTPVKQLEQALSDHL